MKKEILLVAGGLAALSVTLIALVEEEFGTELDVNALGELTSFDSILEQLQTLKVS